MIGGPSAPLTELPRVLLTAPPPPPDGRPEPKVIMWRSRVLWPFPDDHRQSLSPDSRSPGPAAQFTSFQSSSLDRQGFRFTSNLPI